MQFNDSKVSGRMSSSAAVAYFRTSSASGVGEDKDSLSRQQDAVRAYAKTHKLLIVREFYDAAVSGADAVTDRPGFAQMLAYLAGNCARTILVENASRFARDLMVQITGHDLLKSRGIALIPVDAPDHFIAETPTAELVRNILGTVSMFEKKIAVERMRKGLERKKALTGRGAGRKPVADEVIKEARRLARKNPRTGRARSLRKIAAELAVLGKVGPSGAPYGPESVKRMLTTRGGGK